MKDKAIKNLLTPINMGNALERIHQCQTSIADCPNIYMDVSTRVGEEITVGLWFQTGDEVCPIDSIVICSGDSMLLRSIKVHRVEASVAMLKNLLQ